MEKLNATPFMAPDVIALLCRDSQKSLPTTSGNNTTQKPAPQGEQKKLDWKLQNRRPQQIQTTSNDRPVSQNSYLQNSSACPQNAKKKYKPGSQRRSSDYSVAESPQSQHNNAENKYWEKDNYPKKYFRENGHDQQFRKDYYFQQWFGEDNRSKQNGRSNHKQNFKKHPQQKNKNHPEQVLKEKNISEHVLKTDALKQDKCPDVVITGMTVSKFLIDQVSKEKRSNSLPIGEENRTTRLLKEKPETSVNADIAGQEKSTGAIPKITSTFQPLKPSIAKNMSEGSVKVSLDSCQSKLKLLLIQHHFVDNLEAIKSFIKVNYTEDTVGAVVEEAVGIVLKKDCQSREKFGVLISELIGCGLISNVHVVDVLSKLYVESVGTSDECPLIWTWIADFIVPVMVSNRFSFVDLQKAGKPFLKTKFAKHLLITVIKNLIEREGFGFLLCRWQSSGVTMTDFIPHEELNGFLVENNLLGLCEHKPTSLEDIQKHVQSSLKPFMKRREHFEHVLKFITVSLTCIEDVFVSSETNDLLQNIFSLDVIRDEASANYIASTLSDMIGFGLIKPEIAAKHMNAIFDGDDIKNNPQVLQLLAQIFAHLVVTERFDIQLVIAATLPILKTPAALDFFFKFFDILKEKFGVETLNTWLKASGTTLYDLVDRFHVKDLVKRFGFLDCDPNVELQQPSFTLNIQQELVEMIRNREKVEDITDWISVHAASRTKDHAFIIDLISAVCEGSLNKSLDTTVFNKYRQLISNYMKTNEREISTLLALLNLVTSDCNVPIEEKEPLAEVTTTNHRVEQKVEHEKASNNLPQIAQNPVGINDFFNALFINKQETDESQSTVNNSQKTDKKMADGNRPLQTALTTKKPEQNVGNQKKTCDKSPKAVQRQVTKNTADDSTPREKIMQNTQPQRENVEAAIEIKTKTEVTAQTPTSTDSQKGDAVQIGTQSLEQVQINIIETMKKGCHYRYIKQFIDENLAEANKGSCFIKILTNCIIQSSFSDDLKTFKPDNIQYYGKLLKLYAKDNKHFEIVALCALQDFIKVRTELKDHIHSIFTIFSNEEIIHKEAFIEFMDTKIKGDVLKALCTFYNKLMED